MTQDGATEQSEQKGRHEKGTEARPPKTTVKGHRKRERDNLLGTCWGMRLRPMKSRGQGKGELGTSLL